MLTPELGKTLRQIKCLSRSLRGGRASSHGAAGSADEWVDCPEIGETAEVAVGGPKVANAVLHANSGDASVVNTGARDPPYGYERAQLGPMSVRLRKRDQRRRLQPGVDLCDGLGNG